MNNLKILNEKIRVQARNARDFASPKGAIKKVKRRNVIRFLLRNLFSGGLLCQLELPGVRVGPSGTPGWSELRPADWACGTSRLLGRLQLLRSRRLPESERLYHCNQ